MDAIQALTIMDLVILILKFLAALGAIWLCLLAVGLTIGAMVAIARGLNQAYKTYPRAAGCLTLVLLIGIPLLLPALPKKSAAVLDFDANLAADLAAVKQDPALKVEFRKIYPVSYHHHLENL